MLRSFIPPDDNFRVESAPDMPGVGVIRRDFVEPFPAGSCVVTVFRVTGFDRDCDGSAMARMEHVDRHGERTGWEVNAIGLYPDTDLLVDEPGDLWALAEQTGTDR